MNRKLQKLIDFFSRSGTLKTVKRTGWALKGIEEVESVADHSWRVALMAIFLARMRRRKDLDINKILLMALLHDLGEVDIGDLRWEEGRKVIGSQEDKHRDERKTIRQLFQDLGDGNYYLSLWEEFNEQKTSEAKFVKQIDKLEMALQALEYEKVGYSQDLLEEFWENAEKYLENQELEELFQVLKQKRK